MEKEILNKLDRIEIELRNIIFEINNDEALFYLKKAIEEMKNTKIELTREIIRRNNGI